jgi:hypothetical protein
MNNLISIAHKIGKSLKHSVPKYWDGRESILKMKNAGYSQWRQMEWIGFFFQFLCEQNLSNIVKIPGSKYGNVEFDGFAEIPWDFKAHAINTSAHQIIVNDRNTTIFAIKDYGCVGLILALGEVKYNDDKRTFQLWHEKLKGGKSDYTKERIKRGAWSRLRKVCFDLKQICFIEITENTLKKCGIFQTDFRNSDGKPRKSKILIDLEFLDKEIIYTENFKK